MHVSRSTKSFTSHSWQCWRSIYTSHIDFKISPTMIWVHRKQFMLIDAQSHLHKGTRKNIFWDKTQQCRSNFLDFLLFIWFLDFWHTRKKRLMKNNNVKTFNAKANKQPVDNSNNWQLKQPTSTQPNIVTQHRKN